jgi:hypothetical protein
MKLGEILDQGFTVYRRNFWIFAGIAFVPSVIVFALHVVDLTWVHLNQTSHPKDNGEASLIALLVWVIYFHVTVFVFLLFYPAFVKAASAILFQEKVSLLGSLRFAAARWRRYLWIDFLKQFGQFLIPEGLCVGFIALGAYFVRRLSLNSNNILIAFIIIAPTVGALFVMIRFGVGLALAIPAAAFEEIGGFKALRRSWRLSMGGRMRVAVLWTLIAVITGLLWTTLQFIVRVLAEVLYRMAHLHLGEQNLYAMSYYSLTAIFDAVFAPLYPVVLLLLYYDQRVRKEGYDIERMIDAAGLSSPVELASGEDASEPAAVQAARTAPEDTNPVSAGESLA